MSSCMYVWYYNFVKAFCLSTTGETCAVFKLLHRNSLVLIFWESFELHVPLYLQQQNLNLVKGLKKAQQIFFCEHSHFTLLVLDLPPPP